MDWAQDPGASNMTSRFGDLLTGTPALEHKCFIRSNFPIKCSTHTNLCGLHGLCVWQPDAFPEVSEQISGQSAPGGSWTDAVGDFPVFEGNELRAGHIVDREGGALLCGLQDHRHTAVGGELNVQAEDEVFGVTQLEGQAFWGLWWWGEEGGCSR